MTILELKQDYAIGHNEFILLKQLFFKKRKNEEQITETEKKEIFLYEKNKNKIIYKYSYVHEYFFRLGEYSQWYKTNISEYWLNKRNFNHIVVLGRRWIDKKQKQKLIDILTNQYSNQLKKCFTIDKLLNKYKITKDLLLFTLNKSIKNKTYLYNNNLLIPEDKINRFEKSKPFKKYILKENIDLLLEENKIPIITMNIIIFRILSFVSSTHINRVYFIAKTDIEYIEFYYYFEPDQLLVIKQLFKKDTQLTVEYLETKGVQMGPINIKKIIN